MTFDESGKGQAAFLRQIRMKGYIRGWNDAHASVLSVDGFSPNI